VLGGWVIRARRIVSRVSHHCRSAANVGPKSSNSFDDRDQMFILAAKQPQSFITQRIA
jgi:hypothetical protein